MTKKYKDKKIIVPRFNESEGFYTTKERSIHMSKIRGKHTKPELLLRKALYRKGIRYRINVRKLPGKPDVVNISKGFVIFVDGEFWHGYDWAHKRKRIKSNRNFWIPKIERNIQRDEENNKKLEEMGLRVFRFWENEIKKDIDNCVGRLMSFLNS
jgi:DNA mismatch endonuclease (patch repair protein)